MRFSRYLIRRILQLLPVILVVIVLNFVLLHLAPGDAALRLAGEDPNPAVLEAIRERYGLDLPLHQQLWIYLGRVARGDLGESLMARRSVIGIIGDRAGATILLAVTSLFLGSTLGIFLGTLLSARAGSRIDISSSVTAVVGYSIPVFWLGIMLILFFSIRLQWFPVSGMFTILGPRTGIPRLLDVGHHLILPVLTLMVASTAQYLRLARTSVLQVLNEDFIMTLKAVGFSRRAVLVKYALRNAALPIVSMLGLQLGIVLTGAVLTETVFSWPGLGRLVYEGIMNRDTPVIMGAFIIMSIAVALASLLTDLVYAALDPRVKY